MLFFTGFKRHSDLLLIDRIHLCKTSETNAYFSIFFCGLLSDIPLFFLGPIFLPTMYRYPYLT
jgi:hypothetical protein